jgi:hypothetical protein
MQPPARLPAPAPGAEEELAEKDQLLDEGFSNWNRRDFSAFCRLARGAGLVLPLQSCRWSTPCLPQLGHWVHGQVHGSWSRCSAAALCDAAGADALLARPPTPTPAHPPRRCRACEKYGRENLQQVAAEIDGKTEEEVGPPPLPLPLDLPHTLHPALCTPEVRGPLDQTKPTPPPACCAPLRCAPTRPSSGRASTSSTTQRRSSRTSSGGSRRSSGRRTS